MKILAVRCAEEPEVICIKDSLSAKNKFVQGYCQFINISSKACLICNDDAIELRLPPNRIYNGDMIYGDFFIAGLEFSEKDGYSVTDIQDEDINYYEAMFSLTR